MTYHWMSMSSPPGLRIVTSLFTGLLLLCMAQADSSDTASSTVASFSCQQAHTAIEAMICQDPALANADRLLASRYHTLLRLSADPVTLRNDERLWLRHQRNPCQTASCLQQVYQQRLLALQRAIDSQQTPSEPSASGPEASPSQVVAPKSRTPSLRHRARMHHRLAGTQVDPPRASTPLVSVSERGKMLNDMLRLLAITSVISFIALFIMGLTNRVVIFYDSADLTFAVLSVIAAPTLWLLHRFMQSWLFGHLFLLLAFGVSVFCMIKTFSSAIRHNGLGLGMVVGLFKILISLMGALIMLLALTRSTQAHSRTRNVLVASVIGGVLGYVFYLLVNGERVAARKAWEDWLNAKRQATEEDKGADKTREQPEGEEPQYRESTSHNQDGRDESWQQESAGQAHEPFRGAATEPQPWFKVLGVPENAPMDVIHRAYRTLMSQYHPDKTATLGAELQALAEKKAKEINSAFDFIRKQQGMA